MAPSARTVPSRRMAPPAAVPSPDSPPERGSALVMVLLVALVVTAIGSTMAISANTEHAIAANERDAQRASFAADAGLSDAYEQYRRGELVPSAEGTPFHSSRNDGTTSPSGSPPPPDPLEGATFEGLIYDLSEESGQGGLYRIDSTGRYALAERSLSLTFHLAREAFQFGFVGFDDIAVHNHSGAIGAGLQLDTTMFANNNISLPDGLVVNGTAVAGAWVSLAVGATLNGDAFANVVGNAGTINGDARTLAVVDEAADPAAPDLVDAKGRPHDWFSGRSSPGAIMNPGTITGTQDSVAVASGDEFRHSIFTRAGELKPDPDLNVVKYMPPPLLDYAEMKEEADLNDDTFFTSRALACAYIMSKAADEVISGKTVRVARVGTAEAPEFLYVDAAMQLTVVGGTGVTNLATGELAIDGLWIEGGVYSTGNFRFSGPAFDPALHPPGFKQLRVNALPYCYPAIIAYEHPPLDPAVVPIETWDPTETPAMTGSGSHVRVMSAVGVPEGLIHINGTTLSQDESHYHHTEDASELIRFNGAQLGWFLHDCAYLDFSYDPDVACTRFILSNVGTPQVVSYRESQ